MMRFYTDPTREDEATAFPNAEVFHSSEYERILFALGWYWRWGFPDCLADKSSHGPFDTEALAIADARKDSDALPVFYECGICGHCHPWRWNNDCRDDTNRLTCSELEDTYGQDGYELRSMEDRVSADRQTRHSADARSDGAE